MSEEEFQKFLLPLTANQRRICLECHSFLMRFIHVKCEKKFGVPFYKVNGWFCYINPVHGGGVKISFPYAKKFNDKTNALFYGELKLVGSLRLNAFEDIALGVFPSLIQEALEIDRRKDWGSRTLDSNFNNIRLPTYESEKRMG